MRFQAEYNEQKSGLLGWPRLPAPRSALNPCRSCRSCPEHARQVWRKQIRLTGQSGSLLVAVTRTMAREALLPDSVRRGFCPRK